MDYRMNEGTEALGERAYSPGLQFVSCCKNLGDYKRFHESPRPYGRGIL
jgi:hypothetical protein